MASPSSPPYQIFGIRHHGPGSARSLQAALSAYAPDLLLIEGPADADELLQPAALLALRPPVAILVYEEKNLQRAVYFPFAEFSPEWCALQYAAQHASACHARFMDLPQAQVFALGEAERQMQAEGGSEAARQIKADPLGYVARLAGYADSERWWEVMIEQPQQDSAGRFAAVLDLMGELRQASAEAEGPFNLLREAHMRLRLAEAIKQGYRRIGVVCGAWHGPALLDVSPAVLKADRALLKPLAKTKTKATWIPYSLGRFSALYGYGAGVLSPAWYQLLMRRPDEAAARWMVAAGQLLRQEQMDSSPAHATEALRLAQALASLRGLPLPGYEELREAALSILCEGSEVRLGLIEQKLILGTGIGHVPPEWCDVPLQRDIEALRCIKAKRGLLHAAYYEGELLKARELDLRQDTHKEASLLLHRLQVLGIPFGAPSRTAAAAKSRTSGDFKEFWDVAWQPDMTLGLIEANMWGSTLYEAGVRKMRQLVRESADLPQLSGLMMDVLRAELDDVMGELVDKLQAVSALTKDVQVLMAALPNLLLLQQYGSARFRQAETLAQVTDGLIRRVIIGLPGACMGIDDEEAGTLFEGLLDVNAGLGKLRHDAYRADWLALCERIAEAPRSHPKLAGAAARLRFDAGAEDSTGTARLMALRLSRPADAAEGAQWLEGFLHGSGLLLIHQASLWAVLDEWLQALPAAQLQAQLPILRRTFARFSPVERRKMLDMARQPQAAGAAAEAMADLDEARAALVLPILGVLLG